MVVTISPRRQICSSWRVALVGAAVSGLGFSASLAGTVFSCGGGVMSASGAC